MTIRETTDQDLYGLLALYTQLHDNVMPQIDENLTALWKGILQDRHHHIIVAEAEGQILSSCVLVIVPNLTHHQRPYALIENVITDRLHRKLGLATACLDAAKQIAVGNRCYKMMLLTGSKEEGVLRFYQRAGYRSGDKTGFVQWLT